MWTQITGNLVFLLFKWLRKICVTYYHISCFYSGLIDLPSSKFVLGCIVQKRCCSLCHLAPYLMRVEMFFLFLPSVDGPFICIIKNKAPTTDTCGSPKQFVCKKNLLFFKSLAALFASYDLKLSKTGPCISYFWCLFFRMVWFGGQKAYLLSKTVTSFFLLF